ncbi:hypothetical protein, partial [Lentilactobacillus hilgardii]|uniref:hypothetical protein n=1 Tax=Lentilactobacillus hilgardii TaxID=1588 RepID=UPI0039EAA7FF
KKTNFHPKNHPPPNVVVSPKKKKYAASSFLCRSLKLSIITGHFKAGNRETFGVTDLVVQSCQNSDFNTLLLLFELL